MTATATSSTPLPDAPPRSLPQSLSLGWLALILVLAPLKLGCTVNVSNIAFFPLDMIGWIDELWPPLLASVVAGVALILACLAQPPEWALLRRHLHLWLPGLCLVGACLLGLVRTTEWEVALNYLWMTLALPLFALALLVHLSRRPQDAQLLLGCVVLGLVIAAGYGVYQRFVGFDRTLAQLREQMAQGLQVQPAVLARLEEKRIMATFTYPNNFAAHLLLVTPLAACLVWLWCRQVEPPRESQLTMTGLLLLVTGLGFLYAQSRAAAIAAGLGAAAVGIWFTMGHWRFVRRLVRRQPLPVAGAVVLCVVVPLLLLQLFSSDVLTAGPEPSVSPPAAVVEAPVQAAEVPEGRGLSSFEARLHYWRAAWQMFLSNPVLGVGMGEFFPWYLRLKPVEIEPTRIAHNVLLSYLSQTGILGGLAALYFLAAPLLVWRRYRQRRVRVQGRWIWLCMFIGWAAWAAHSFADFNFQIPGTLLTAVALPILCMRFEAPAEPAASSRLSPLCIGLMLAGCIGVANLWQAPGEYLYQSFDLRLKNPQQPPLGIWSVQERVEAIAGYKPFSPYPWETLGLYAMHLREPGVAVDAFTEAIARTPHRPAFHARLAEALLAVGRLEDAAAAIDRALLWSPDDPRYLLIQDSIEAAANAP